MVNVSENPTLLSVLSLDESVTLLKYRYVLPDFFIAVLCLILFFSDSPLRAGV
jgi:hypothetical protein